MSKKKPHKIQQSALKAVLRTPLFKQRVVQDKTQYNRKKDRSHALRREDSIECVRAA